MTQKTSVAFSSRHERVATYVEASTAHAEADVDQAGVAVDQALAQRSAASRALRDADESEADLAGARLRVARSRHDRTVASLDVAQAVQRKLRAAAEEYAWTLEVIAIEQGNPYDPHTPEGAAWMAGYGDAAHNPDIAPEVSGSHLEKIFGDAAQHFIEGRTAGAQARQ